MPKTRLSVCNWLQPARNSPAENSSATIGMTESGESSSRKTSEIHPWEEEWNKNGVKTETLVGYGLFTYPGRSCCDVEISKHTNTVCNILQQRQECRHVQFILGNLLSRNGQFINRSRLRQLSWDNNQMDCVPAHCKNQMGCVSAHCNTQMGCVPAHCNNQMGCVPALCNNQMGCVPAHCNNH